MSDVSQETGSDLSGDRVLPAFFSLHLCLQKFLSGCLSRARARALSAALSLSFLLSYILLPTK